MRRRDIGSDDGEPDGAGRRDWVVAVAVDHGGEQGQPCRRADHAGTDSPADAPGPPADHGTRGADRDGGPEPASGGRRPGVLADPGRRAAEHWMRRALVERVYGLAREAWAEAVPELRAAWGKIKEKYDYPERPPATPRPADGSWRGAGGRRLDAAQHAEVNLGYARIRDVGEKTIIPGILAVAAEDPSRRLAGFDHRFKGEDRLKEKVADQVRSTPGTTPAQALAAIPDAVRFTYQYSETAYTDGVRKDMERLVARGFVQVERRNTWMSDQYKGINTRWREPESRVLFEVQFHTQASLEAKELTHKAYEYMRSTTEKTPEAEQETTELREFQRQVNARVPIPPDVTEIEDYRPERRNGRRD